MSIGYQDEVRMLATLDGPHADAATDNDLVRWLLARSGQKQMG